MVVTSELRAEKELSPLDMMGELADQMDNADSMAQVVKDYPFIGRLYLVAVEDRQRGRMRTLKAYNAPDGGDALVEITYSSLRPHQLSVQIGDAQPYEELTETDVQLIRNLHDAFVKEVD